MTTTSAIPITVDGVRLDTYAWNIETKNGRFYVPGVRGSNAQVPGRHGSLFVPSKKFDDGRFILSMWAQGTDVNGAAPGSGTEYNQFRKNMDQLMSLFTKRPFLMDVQKDDGSGTMRQAFCEVIQAIDPDVFGVNPTGKFTVELDIPGVFWQDTADQNYSSLTGVTTSFSFSLAAFAGATAPMEDLYLVVDGPIANPRIIDAATGHYIQYNGTVAGGNQWVVNTTLWTSKVGAGIAFTQSGTDVTNLTVFTGAHAPRYLALTPKNGDLTTAPTMQLTNTGSSSGATQMRVRGRRKFL